jgi:hypothetical protein
MVATFGPRRPLLVTLKLAKSGPRSVKHEARNSCQPPPTATTQDRRRFLRTSASLAATGLTLGAIGLSPLPARTAALNSQPTPSDPPTEGTSRAEKSFTIRKDTALHNRNLPFPDQINNGDEERYPERIACFTKGLPHDEAGIVKAPAYEALLKAIRTGEPSNFETIPLGGTVRLVNPQAGLTFDLEGTDSHQLMMRPAPAFASAERAAEAAECYWMALLRDVSFAQYATNEAAIAACEELPD